MIVIINGCGANFASVEYALQRLGKEAIQTSDPEHIQAASHVILPGVGTAAYAMTRLKQLGLIQLLRSLTQPVLGICLGMQLLYEYSEEGDIEGLGILEGKVKLLQKTKNETIPHMGWNQLSIIDHQSSLLEGILPHAEGQAWLYFVHSYAAPVNEYTLAVTEYTRPFAAVSQKQNFYGVQFHPERSGETGAKILNNFLRL